MHVTVGHVKQDACCANQELCIFIRTKTAVEQYNRISHILNFQSLFREWIDFLISPQLKWSRRAESSALYLMMKQCFLKSHLPNRTCRSKPKYTPHRAPAPCPFFLDYYKRTIETMYYQHVEIYLSLAAPLGDRHKSLIHPRDNNYVILIPRWSRFRKDNLS